MAGWEPYQKYISTKHTLDSTPPSDLCDTTIALETIDCRSLYLEFAVAMETARREDASMSDGDDEALTLGERLLAGVRNLWRETDRLSKVADHHGVELENLKRRMNSLEREVHGLKVARGKAVAKSARLQGYLSEAVSKLAEIHEKLN